MRAIFLFINLILFSTAIFSQTLPTIRATAKTVDVQDGDNFRKGKWILTTKLRPDVYTSNQLGKTITFYTDIDSISFLLEKDKVIDFIILWNENDTCVTQLKYKPSYLDILKLAKEYDYDEKVELPAFTFQDSSAAELQALRKAFNLDSIAGQGGEVAKMLNLLHWIHNLVPHDGQHGNPAIRNAMNMISVCQKSDRGLNCRGLAIVLNECYLSLGFKSRYMTCLPKDSTDNDCHVINMVYSYDLGRWIWLDPTHDAYLMDEQGQLLGFKEVRARLIDNQQIILNPDANWNHQQSTGKDHYLGYYMAKNLYHFQTPIHSKYDYETYEGGEIVEFLELNPLDYGNPMPAFSTSKLKSGTIFNMYRIHNPDLFWAKPE